MLFITLGCSNANKLSGSLDSVLGSGNGSSSAPNPTPVPTPVQNPTPNPTPNSTPVQNPTPNPTPVQNPTPNPTPVPTPVGTPPPGGSIFVSQNGGTFNGGSACNGKTSISISSSNGRTYKAGDVVYLCGAITTAPNFSNGSGGTSGNPFTIRFDVGARVTLPYCNTICFNVSGNYITVDGGTPCGPGTACAAAEAANPKGYPSGITGIVEATQSGTIYSPSSAKCPASTCNGPAADGRPIANGQGIWINGSNVTVQNMIVRNIYQHTDPNDGNGDAYSTAGVQGQMPSFTIHDSTIHDAAGGVIIGSSGAAASNESIYFNNFYHFNWGVGGGATGTLVNSNISIHDNHFANPSNFSNYANTYHHNGVMLYGDAQQTGTFNGVYIYNNLFDGQWAVNNPNDGTNSLGTTGMIFFDEGQFLNAYIYNNVGTIQGQSTCLTNSIFTLGATSGSTEFVYNNTLLDAGSACYGHTGPISVRGHVTFVNNISANNDQVIDLQGASPGSPIVDLDYNVYGNAKPGAVFRRDDLSQYFPSLSAWQANTGQESHSSYTQSGVSVNNDGTLQSGSPANGAGKDLTSVCNSNSNLVALCKTTSAGHTKTPVTRSVWNAGAY